MVWPNILKNQMQEWFIMGSLFYQGLQIREKENQNFSKSLKNIFSSLTKWNSIGWNIQEFLLSLKDVFKYRMIEVSDAQMSLLRGNFLVKILLSILKDSKILDAWLLKNKFKHLFLTFKKFHGFSTNKT